MSWRPEIDESGDKPSMLFSSGGFELYVPPTPLRPPPKAPIFVMLEDDKDAFYEVDYQPAELRNTTPWADLKLHTVTDPAIVFPSLVWEKFENFSEAKKENMVIGFLVSIQSREEDVWTATKLGALQVRKYPDEVMNYRALESVKGPELGAEMQAGLLRHLFNRRPGSDPETISYVTPGDVLDAMTDPFHDDPARLNYHLDERFVGAARISKDQKWRLFAN